MKRLILGILVLLVAFAGCAAGSREAVPEQEATPEVAPGESEEESVAGKTVYAKQGGNVLEITLENNSSAAAFYRLLEKGDLVVSMHEYGGFEKVGSLGATLPRNDVRITTAPGDVILYLGTEITIYYGTNTWSFTRLGRIEGATRDSILNALGGTSTNDVTFSLNR